MQNNRFCHATSVMLGHSGKELVLKNLLYCRRLTNQICSIMKRKTFRTIYRLWLNAKASEVKESSLATYSAYAEKHLLPFFGDKTVIDSRLVQDFVSVKRTAGLSRNTLRSLLQMLRMIAGFGLSHGLSGSNTWEARLPKGEECRRPRVFSAAEQRRLMDFLRQNLSFRNLGLYLCLCTGMRIGEICALRWSDIRLEERAISVRRTIQRINSGGSDGHMTKVIITTPKTQNSLRDIPISAELARLLRPVMTVSCRDNYLLSNSRRPVEPRLMRRHYLLLMQRLGLPQLNFHSLRHTFATRCIESRCDCKTLSAILGHANIATTLNLYVHPDMEQKRRCINNMLKRVM